MRGHARTASLRFYAELNDFLAPERRYRDSSVRFTVPVTVKDAIESLGVPHTEVDLVLVDGEPAAFARLLEGGERVSVYPVFEAFDIRPVTRVRPEPLRRTRFVLDVHLGRLARYLRMLGFDTAYGNRHGDETLARLSAEEGRILLTRDRGLLKRSAVTHGYYVRETNPRRQLVEVVARFDLARSFKPFTRCLRCNAALSPVAQDALASRLPPGVRARHEEFLRCEGCGNVYWGGTHHARMNRMVEEIRSLAGPA